jgi:hypothetical protein
MQICSIRMIARVFIAFLILASARYLQAQAVIIVPSVMDEIAAELLRRDDWKWMDKAQVDASKEQQKSLDRYKYADSYDTITRLGYDNLDRNDWEAAGYWIRTEFLLEPIKYAQDLPYGENTYFSRVSSLFFGIERYVEDFPYPQIKSTYFSAGYEQSLPAIQSMIGISGAYSQRNIRVPYTYSQGKYLRDYSRYGINYDVLITDRQTISLSYIKSTHTEHYYRVRWSYGIPYEQVIDIDTQSTSQGICYNLLLDITDTTWIGIHAKYDFLEETALRKVHGQEWSVSADYYWSQSLSAGLSYEERSLYSTYQVYTLSAQYYFTPWVSLSMFLDRIHRYGTSRSDGCMFGASLLFKH